MRDRHTHVYAPATASTHIAQPTHNCVALTIQGCRSCADTHTTGVCSHVKCLWPCHLGPVGHTDAVAHGTSHVTSTPFRRPCGACSAFFHNWAPRLVGEGGGSCEVFGAGRGGNSMHHIPLWRGTWHPQTGIVLWMIGFDALAHANTRMRTRTLCSVQMKLKFDSYLRQLQQMCVSVYVLMTEEEARELKELINARIICLPRMPILTGTIGNKMYSMAEVCPLASSSL